MSKWLKQFLFGIWGLLLIPLIMPILEKWLEQNVFSDPNGIATTVFRDAMATTAFDNLRALGQQRWLTHGREDENEEGDADDHAHRSP